MYVNSHVACLRTEYMHIFDMHRWYFYFYFALCDILV